MQRRVKGQRRGVVGTEVAPAKKPCRSSGKVKWKSEEDAGWALNRGAHSGSIRRNEIRYYKCPDCDFWHLSSKPLKVLHICEN